MIHRVIDVGWCERSTSVKREQVASFNWAHAPLTFYYLVLGCLLACIVCAIPGSELSSRRRPTTTTVIIASRQRDLFPFFFKPNNKTQTGEKKLSPFVFRSSEIRNLVQLDKCPSRNL